jgi:hypothetical protein
MVFCGGLRYFSHIVFSCLLRVWAFLRIETFHMIVQSRFRVNQRFWLFLFCVVLSGNVLFANSSLSAESPPSLSVTISNGTLNAFSPTSVQRLTVPSVPSDGLIRFRIENDTATPLTFGDLTGKSEAHSIPALSSKTVTAAFNEHITYVLRDTTSRKIIRKWQVVLQTDSPPRSSAMPASTFPVPKDHAIEPDSATVGSETPPPAPSRAIAFPATSQPTDTEPATPSRPHPIRHMARPAIYRSPIIAAPATAKPPTRLQAEGILGGTPPQKPNPSITPPPAEAASHPAKPTTSPTGHIASQPASQNIKKVAETPLTVGQPSSNNKPPTAQESELKPAPPATTEAFQPKVLYKSSDEMYLNIPTAYPVDIALSTESERKAEQIDFSDGHVAKQPIPVASAYTLALHDDDGAFKIKLAIQQKNETQETRYSPDGVLHWVWTVTPIREGEHILNLSISGPHGEFLFPARIIHVHVKNPLMHVLGQLPDFMKDNWIWISGLAIALWTVFLVLSGRKKLD